MIQAKSATPIRALCLAAMLLFSLAGRSEATDFAIEYIDNAAGDFAARGWLSSQSLFQRNVAAAAAEWGARIDSTETLLIRVESDNSSPRLGGTFSNGLTIGQVGVRDLLEPGPLSRIRTGANPGATFFGFDILISINAQFVDDFYWIDTEPEQRTSAVPFDRSDLISVLMHELGHGLGMAGLRSFADDATYGTLHPTALQSIDNASSFGGNGLVEDAMGNPNPMFFTGAASSAIYGGPVPLANVGRLDFLFSQNFYHLGTCTDPAILTGSLMNGCSTPIGARLDISAIDLAVFEDLGYPTVPEPSVALSIATALASLAGLARGRSAQG